MKLFHYMLNKLSEFKCLGFVTQSENKKHQVRHTRDCFKDKHEEFLAWWVQSVIREHWTVCFTAKTDLTVISKTQYKTAQCVENIIPT